MDLASDLHRLVDHEALRQVLGMHLEQSDRDFGLWLSGRRRLLRLPKRAGRHHKHQRAAKVSP
ncbi:hypothetical protein [Mesorhizobium sp. B261B1A]|uniref:hypothetical protein n=1 Tax=Mesorhizobium sp. B261B1A TaxID=2876671 RepID=UPI001CD07597|nr:hypothetical protein [Mesorhizobium sp. B261B1A]MCA0057119.1 hypothetical protein [Mesorhizobium sp. B261B1A]